MDRQVGAIQSYAEDLLARGKTAFSLEQAMQATGLSGIAARNQVLRLGGRIVRASPRQPFFLIVSPEHRTLGAPPAELWLHDYFQWLEHPYYVALQSAAALHGSQPQAIQVLQVMTDTPRRPLAPGRLKIRFFVKSSIEAAAAQWVAGARAPLRVSTPEATVLDLVLYADRVGGIERVVETIRPMLRGLRAGGLETALQAAPSTAAGRLADALARAGDRRLSDAAREAAA